MTLFLKLQKNAGRSQDMASVEEGSVHAGRDLKDLRVLRGPPEIIQAIQCVESGIKRFVWMVGCPLLPDLACMVPCVFLLQVGRIQDDQPRQLARG